MSAEIIVSWGNKPETSFPVSRSVFDFLCDVVGQVALKRGDHEVWEICESAKKDKNLLLVNASIAAKLNFRNILRELLNNGTIIKEIISWPIPRIDNSMLLPENNTNEIISFIYNLGVINNLRRLTIYLDSCINTD